MTRPQQSYIENGRRKVSDTYLSCLPTLAALATVTHRVTLGTDILNIPRRNPVDVANEVAAIDHISGGRFILQGAVGQPTRDWDPLLLNSSLKERGEMMEEALTIIKALWTHDEPITFTGRYYRLEEARVGSRPTQKPHPPIWLGIGKTFKRVARFASGFTLTASQRGGTLEDYKHALEKIHAEARRIGRDPGEIDAAARFALVMEQDDRRAKSRAIDHWTKLRGREEPWYKTWAGDADTITKIVVPYIETGARHILVYPLPYGSAPASIEDMTYFAEKVIPRLREWTTYP